MKEGVLLAVLCVLIVAAVGWYLLPAPAREFFTATTVVVKPAGNSQQTDVNTPKPASAKHRLHGPARSSERNAAQAEPELPVIGTTALRFQVAPVVIVRQFPTPQDVKIGSAASDIVDAFGDPTLAAATQNRGHYLQTYVYRKNRSQAIIHLEDGRVAYAYVR